MTMLPKKQMSEEDIKLQFITPAITAKWDITKITMETKRTDGKINSGNLFWRQSCSLRQFGKHRFPAQLLAQPLSDCVKQ